MEPFFSIVITVFNKENYITDTIQSVLDQSYKNFEVIILNDGSTDDSETKILKFSDPRIRYFSQKNKGAATARNFAISKSRNEYIALLDADDHWYPFYLEEQKKSINAYPEEFVFATATEVKIHKKSYDSSYSIKANNGKPIKTNYFEGSFLTSILHSSSTVIRKNVFEEVGWYDPSIKSGQDTDLYVRIGLEYDVVFNPKVCATYIVRKNSLFQNTKKIEDKANFEAYESYEKDNPALKKFLDLNRYSLCILAKMEGDELAFQRNFQKIDQTNLSKKQQFMLRQNRFVLRGLSKTKKSFEKMGLRLSTFK